MLHLHTLHKSFFLFVLLCIFWIQIGVKIIVTRGCYSQGSTIYSELQKSSHDKQSCYYVSVTLTQQMCC